MLIFENDKIGEKIKAYRVLRRMSMNQLAKAADISLTNLWKIEGGLNNSITTEVLNKLIMSLQIDILDLMKEV